MTVTVTVMAKLANMMSEREMELGFGLERVDYSTQTYLENMMSPFRMAFDDYHSDVTLQYSQDPQDELLAEQDLREFDPEVESAAVGDEESGARSFEAAAEAEARPVSAKNCSGMSASSARI